MGQGKEMSGDSVSQGGEANLVDKYCAAQATPACLLQDSEGAVILNYHHLHRDALGLGLLHGKSKVEPIPSVVLHNEEGARCRDSGMVSLSLAFTHPHSAHQQHSLLHASLTCACLSHSSNGSQDAAHRRRGKHRSCNDPCQHPFPDKTWRKRNKGGG